MIADPRHPGSANRATKLRRSAAQLPILPLASVCLTRPLSYPHDVRKLPRVCKEVLAHATEFVAV